MGIKYRMTITQKAEALIALAASNYLDHFGAPRTGIIMTKEQQDAAIFGFVYAQTLNEDAEVREVAYQALQKHFGWDDEYIATQVIGG